MHEPEQPLLAPKGGLDLLTVLEDALEVRDLLFRLGDEHWHGEFLQSVAGGVLGRRDCCIGHACLLAASANFGSQRWLECRLWKRWWATRDSNPDELPHTPLKRARLPVPPAARLRRSPTRSTFLVTGPVDSTGTIIPPPSRRQSIRGMNPTYGLLNFCSSNEHVGVVGPPAEDLRHRRGDGRDRVDRLCPRHPLPDPRPAWSHSRGRHRRGGSSGARLRCMCMGVDALYGQRQVGLGADEHLDRTVGGRRDRVVLLRGRPEDPHAVSIAG